MIRPLELKDKGVSLLHSEDVSQLLKEATFYLALKTERMDDKSYKFWLNKKAEEGYMEKDIEILKNDCWRGKFRFLLPSVDKLPSYILECIDRLLEANNMVPKKIDRNNNE